MRNEGASPHAGWMGILIRASAFIAGWAVFYAVLAGTASTGEGANIGAGLLAFALTAGASGGWGFFDGRRMGIDRLAVIWAVTGILMGVMVTVFIAVTDGGIDWRVLASDMLFLVPFIATVMAGPAVLGGAVGVSSVRHRPGRRTRPVP